MMQKDDINKKTYNAIADIYVEEADLDHEDKSYLRDLNLLLSHKNQQ